MAAKSAKKKATKKPVIEADKPLNYEERRAEGGRLKIGSLFVKVTPEEAWKVLRIREELREEGALLPCGSKVVSNLDALRFVLGQVNFKEDSDNGADGKFYD